MLQLIDIVKTYRTGSFQQDALQSVSLGFRANEFVAILGPSGSGKTTLLNIIGGLDRYTSGDLLIEGVSTKTYRDRDWDAYRNRAIGFVFQSYNLIPHQSVLANVELALTLAGVSRSERKERAKNVLTQVGLAEHMHKRPNQLSGGQMQRVAIARALVNDPEILLADEPTGAIDSDTSIQIMNLLQTIAKDRLVIMVTHNPELAEHYATRIIKLRDGVVTHDSNPVESLDPVRPEKKPGRVGMSFITALALSFNNLKSKIGRTILTAFAGSIGIIGIALILSLSSGAQDYIDRMQKDTLSSYPITLQASGIEFDAPPDDFSPPSQNEHAAGEPNDLVYQAGQAAQSLRRRTLSRFQNDLTSFKHYLEQPESHAITDLTTGIQYGYALGMDIYTEDPNTEWVLLKDSNQSDGNTPFDEVRRSSGLVPTAWTELIDNPERLQEQFELLAGNWPQDYSQVMLVVDQNQRIRDLTLYNIGIKDPAELEELRQKIIDDETIETGEPVSYTFDQLLGKRYRILQPFDYYSESEERWVENRETEHVNELLDEAPEVQIAGIIRPLDDAAQAAVNGSIGYTKALSEHLMQRIEQADIIRAQEASPEKNILSGLDFIDLSELDDEAVIEQMSEAEQTQLQFMPEAEKPEFLLRYRQQQADTYESVLERLGRVRADEPSSINLYVEDFEARNALIDQIDQYNQARTDAGAEDEVIGYTDIVGLMTSSVTDIIGIISYLLIGFVSISLVVSSIMIGIITYISVLERTKEIGILRSIGASKADISRVFNAETTLIGLAAGALGIGISLLLLIPVNRVIENLSGAQDIAFLPPGAALILILISLALSFLAGLIPSRMAANKDPVIALRTE